MLTGLVRRVLPAPPLPFCPDSFAWQARRASPSLTTLLSKTMHIDADNGLVL